MTAGRRLLGWLAGFVPAVAFKVVEAGWDDEIPE